MSQQVGKTTANTLFVNKVLYLSDDGKSGVFLSPTRGIIEYDARSDAFSPVSKDDPRVPSLTVFPETAIPFLAMPFSFLMFWKKAGCFPYFRAFFQKMKSMSGLFAMCCMAY